ncbi:Rv2175c family DNA-binding protein [Agreia sp.]|uniref:Rv2175c family DNA-binding protein n=1 Tax=Agreia sp. TaxID=1872416 RepID=UPI0035BC7D9A
MSENAPARTWLTIPDVAELFGSTPGRVRKLIEEHSLLAIRRDKVLVVPDVFVRDGEPLPELRGTIIVLLDSGFTVDESMRWLLEVEDSLGVAPIDALLAGRKAEVRRVAQALA